MRYWLLRQDPLELKSSILTNVWFFILVHLIVTRNILNDIPICFYGGVGVFGCTQREVDLIIPPHYLHLRLEVWLLRVSNLNNNPVFRIVLYLSNRSIICDIKSRKVSGIFLQICHYTTIVSMRSQPGIS